MSFAELLQELNRMAGFQGQGSVLSENEGLSESSSGINPGNFQYQDMYAQSLAQRLTGNEEVEAPEGFNWASLGGALNPVSLSQLRNATYDSMRGQMGQGISSLGSELMTNLGKVSNRGFASSGFTDRKREAARDIYGKKAQDVLLGAGKTRQDYMSSLIKQMTADEDIMRQWYPAEST